MLFIIMKIEVKSTQNIGKKGEKDENNEKYAVDDDVNRFYGVAGCR